jgi:hypothetical protein
MRIDGQHWRALEHCLAFAWRSISSRKLVPFVRSEEDVFVMFDQTFVRFAAERLARGRLSCRFSFLALGREQ